MANGKWQILGRALPAGPATNPAACAEDISPRWIWQGITKDHQARHFAGRQAPTAERPFGDQGGEAANVAQTPGDATPHGYPVQGRPAKQATVSTLG